MSREDARWTLETRIRVALVATAALLAPVVGLAIWGFSEVAARVRAASSVEAVQLRAVAEASQAVAQAQIARARFARTGDPLHAHIAQERLGRAIEHCRESLGASDRERPTFMRAGRLLRAARDRIAEETLVWTPSPSLDTEVEPDPDAARFGNFAGVPARVGRVEELLDEAERILGGIGDRVWAELDRATEQIDRLCQRWLRNLITAALVTVLGLLAAAIVLPGRVAQPLRDLRALVRRVEREGRIGPQEIARFADDQTRKVAATVVATAARSRETIALQAERIRVLEQRYRALLRQHPRPALVVGPDHRVTLAGGPLEPIFGLSATAVEGRPIDALFSPDGLPAVLRRIAAEGDGRAVALVNARKEGGGSSKVQATVTAVRDEDRRVREYLVVLGPEGPAKASG